MRVIAGILCGAFFAASTSAWQCVALVLIICIQGPVVRQNIMAIFGFYIAAGAPLFFVFLSYNDNYVNALVTFMTMVLINALPVSVAITQRVIPNWLAIPICFILLSVPPISAVNPLTIAPLAGWLFPGAGIFGLIVFVLLIAGLCTKQKLQYPIATVVTLAAISGSTLQAKQFDDRSGIQAISFVRVVAENKIEDIFRTAYRFEELDLINENNASISVLPESVFGVWMRSDGEIMSNARGDVYGGARHYVSDKEYINVVVDGKTGQIVYEQQNPPLVLIRNGAKATGGKGTIEDREFSIVLCYELANPWIATRAFTRAKPIVWMSNLSWNNSHYLENRMSSILTAWSKLFNVRTHKAVLRHA